MVRLILVESVFPVRKYQEGKEGFMDITVFGIVGLVLMFIVFAAMICPRFIRPK